MQIVGCLSWYDESPSWLAVATAGYARVCDHIVAVDGAYAAYPGGRACSRPDQAEAVLSACEAAGVGCTIHRPPTVWHGNEIEKRTFAMRLAGLPLREGHDWIMVFDADYHLLQSHPERVRQMLATTDRDVATYTLLDGIDFQDPDKNLTAYAASRPLDHEWTTRTRDVFRWYPDMHYVGTHYTLKATIDGREAWLKGYDSSELSYLEPALHLDDALVAHHRSEDRSFTRRAAAKEYYDRREQLNLEQPPALTGAPDAD